MAISPGHVGISAIQPPTLSPHALRAERLNRSTRVLRRLPLRTAFSRKGGTVKCIIIIASWLLAASGAAADDIAGLNAALPAGSDIRAKPTLSAWTHQGGRIAYLFGGMVTLDTPASRPHTELAVG